MDVILYNKFGEEVARSRVNKNETVSDRVVTLLLEKSWILKQGDTIAVEKARRSK